MGNNQKQRDAEKYAARKANGLCVTCGIAPASKASVKCDPCRLNGNAITWINRKENVEQGKCAVCKNDRNLHHTFCDTHWIKKKVAGKRKNRELKIEVLSAYGDLACICCGEQNVAFLTLDHVNNDGWKERNEHGKIRYASYARLKKEGFPKDPPLQVMCYNCNNGKRTNDGICPHIFLAVEHEAVAPKARLL